METYPMLIKDKDLSISVEKTMSFAAADLTLLLSV